MEARLVTLCTYQFVIQAETVKIALGHEGITAYIHDANMVTTDWFLGSALGWIKLQVAEEDVPAALEILKRHPRLTQPFKDSDLEDEAMSNCLSCGAAMGEKNDRCSACGWSFLDEEESENA